MRNREAGWREQIVQIDGGTQRSGPEYWCNKEMFYEENFYFDGNDFSDALRFCR